MLALFAWWAVPLLAVAVIAGARGAWHSFRRSRSDALDGVEAHQRFQAALERDRRLTTRR